MFDCGEEFCICSICADNRENGGECGHCITCFGGDKADGSEGECFKKIN